MLILHGDQKNDDLGRAASAQWRWAIISIKTRVGRSSMGGPWPGVASCVHCELTAAASAAADGLVHQCAAIAA
jgi:hypothetical protein